LLFNAAESDIDAVAWSLTAFASVTDPSEGRWNNAFGEQIRFPLVIESAMGALERATSKLNEPMANQSSERVSDLVHEFACSGTHLVYGLATCLRAGWLEPEFSERMKSQ
jgi:hypothetical protein